MHPCNRGETLTRSVHENAANRKVVTTTRAHFCERAELFIALRSSNSRRRCANNLLGTTRKSCLFYRLASGTRHDVCPVQKFSTLRGRGPFPPICGSRSVGADPPGRDS